jgi:hypothetical protein
MAAVSLFVVRSAEAQATNITGLLTWPRPEPAGLRS